MKDRKIIFFSAHWCPVCARAYKDIITPVMYARPDKVEAINAWDHPGEAKKYNITKLPSLVWIEDGKPVLVAIVDLNAEPQDIIDWIDGELD